MASGDAASKPALERLACVDVPALPLQLLLLGHPEWAGLPIAVVDEDKPTGLLLWVNGPARDGGVLPGQRYGPALSLLPALRAGTVSESAIQGGVRDLLDRLYVHTPEVEPNPREPGVFWLDAGGFERLYESLEVWADGLRADLRAMGWVAGVAVGFSRFGSYAAARALRGRKTLVFPSREAQDAAVAAVPLSLIALPPGVRDALAKLGVHHIGEFLRLPGKGVARRFGPEAHALHRFASGDLELPLSPVPPTQPVEAHLDLDYLEKDVARLIFALKPLVDRLLARLAERGEALAELTLRLALDGRPERVERIRPASPTLASVPVMELVRLRLEAGPLEAAVTGIAAEAGRAPATAEQLALFNANPRRDPAAAARAFARLRAAWGEGAVTRAVLRDRHSPEAGFAWEPLARLAMPQATAGAPATLVRRLLATPAPLPPGAPPGGKPGPDGWLIRGPASGPVERLVGPYRLSGGWWRGGVERDYYWAETARGELLWVFWCRVRRRWFMHGEVS